MIPQPGPPVRVLFCGDRQFPTPADASDLIAQISAKYGRGFLVVHGLGSCELAQAVRNAARRAKVRVEEHKPDMMSSSSPTARAVELMDALQPDCVYAFHTHIPSSRRTLAVLRAAQDRHLATALWDGTAWVSWQDLTTPPEEPR